jgi:hypothetical protein
MTSEWIKRMKKLSDVVDPELDRILIYVYHVVVVPVTYRRIQPCP